MDGHVHVGCTALILLVSLDVLVPFCHHPLDAILGLLILRLFHLNGMNECHDTTDRGWTQLESVEG